MKGLYKYLLLISLVLATSAYGYPYEAVEVYSDGEDPCCMRDTFMGLYVGINGGYSWYRFNLHRPPDADLFPIEHQNFRLTQRVPVLALGYDFYPKSKIPARFELNFSYSQVHFSNDPLFVSTFDTNFYSNDEFFIYNTMLTAFIDWHTCTRLVPYLGVSGGYDVHRAKHTLKRHIGDSFPATFSTIHSFSYGGTIGTRFFFTNHFIGNLQFRFTDLNKLPFNSANVDATNLTDYLSDKFHETTVLIGIAYEF